VYTNVLLDFPQKFKNGLAGDFPHVNPECKNCACCKRRIVSRISAAAGESWKSVLIGDGRSDYCAARHADAVFAKGRLAEFCQRENIPSHSWDDFNDVLAHPLFTE
jgi:2-hydroxy-3-keto-5-methylthiopentenyl-1-phosphate phosphatase